MKEKNSSLKSILIFVISVAILTFFDQLSKIIMVDALKTTKTIPLIKNVLEFYYIENTGTAWGMFGGGRIFFLVLTVIIMAVLVYITYKLPTTKKYMLMRITIILLGSGAVGNFIDRLFLGYVRDFIYFRLINFPVFNVADIYVTCGVICLFFLILFVYSDKEFDEISAAALGRKKERK